MEISNYAPVLITTLNRYDHFKSCLESLERCTGADKTEVFVALDYPPSEKYIDGWKKLDKYLQYKEVHNCFKILHVFRRDHNYGVCKPGDNFSQLVEDVTKKFERYIITEDDNVFSKSYLQYVNWGLEYYKDDEKVIAICAYGNPLKLPEISKDANYFFNKDYGPYGPGFWAHKSIKMTFEGLEKLIHSPKVLEYSLKCRMGLFANLLNMRKRRTLQGDGYFLATLVANDLYCVYPIHTFVLNKGWDGSGIHGGVVKDYLNQTMDEQYSPDKFIRASKREEELLQQTYMGYWKKYSKWYQDVIDYIIISWYRMTGKFLDLYYLKGVIKKIIRKRKY